MYLHEEYIHRHKLNVPVVLYKNRTVLLLRRQNPANWRILTMEWQFDYGHPGYWYSMMVEPIHASFRRSRNFNHVFRPQQVYFDKYDEFLNNIIKDHKDWEPVGKEEDRGLFCWELLLYICDNWFSQCSLRNDREFTKCLFNSLDKNASLVSRWEEYQDAWSMVDEASIIDFFEFNVNNYHNSGSEWLAELFKNGPQNILSGTN